MQVAKACQILPTKLQTTASPPKLPPTYNPQPPNKLPRALSITAPPPELITTVQENKTDDDTVAAFWDYQFLFVSQRAETVEPVTLRLVDGVLPHDFPSGTYYLTGPGLFSDDHGSTVHPLDGHGYLRAFSFDAPRRRVEFMARYIETEAQVEERDPFTGEWRFTHRGPFSVLKGGKMMGNTKVMKNVANTSVLRWGGRLFCLWEGGDPYEIEAPTLVTLGRFNVFGGRKMLPENDEGRRFTADFLDVAAQILKPVLHGVFKMTPKRLLSHYKIDTKRNRLLVMSCNAEDMLLPRSNFTFYEFDGNFKLVRSREYSIPDHLMIHDWAFTDSHYILFGNRIKLDVAELKHDILRDREPWMIYTQWETESPRLRPYIQSRADSKLFVISVAGSMAAVCGLSPMISALTLNPSKPTSPIYLLPRFSNAEPNRLRDWRIPIEAPSQMWVLHVGNAFEERGKDGNLDIQIQASGCSYRWFNFQKMFGYDWQSGKLDPSMMNPMEGQQKLLPHLVQVNISMDKNENCLNCDTSELSNWDKPSDFPVINQDFSGKKNRYVYAATSSGRRQALPHFPFDTVVKLNTVDRSACTWSTGRRRFIGEPIFITKGDGQNEDAGYVMVVEYAVSTQRCYLVVLDSTLIGKHNTLVARFEVPKHLNFPLGFHGFWAPN